jgi:hypothetical protein
MSRVTWTGSPGSKRPVGPPRENFGDLRDRQERIEELERARDGLLGSLEAMAPEALGCLDPEERRHFYGLLPLQVLVHPDGTPEVLLSAPAAGVEAGTKVCTGATLP